VGPRAGLDRSGKSRPIGIRSADRPAHSQSLYRLRYPGHTVMDYVKLNHVTFISGCHVFMKTLGHVTQSGLMVYYTLPHPRSQKYWNSDQMYILDYLVGIFKHSLYMVNFM
jgi:hypothetical protein